MYTQRNQVAIVSKLAEQKEMTLIFKSEENKVQIYNLLWHVSYKSLNIPGVTHTLGEPALVSMT